MEARRNLESVLKRRLDESEKKRMQTELQLLVVKQYLLLDDSGEVNDISGALMNILDRMDQLQSELKQIMSGHSHITNTAGINYNDAIKLAKLQLDEIHFNPQSTLTNAVVNLITDTFNVQNSVITVQQELQDACINLDYRVLYKVFKALVKMFEIAVKDYQISITFDRTSSLLRILFSSENLRVLLSMFSVAQALFDDQTTSQTVIDDLSVLAFIVKGLCQSTGGNAQCNEQQPFNLEILISCEIVPIDQCPIDAAPILHSPLSSSSTSDAASNPIPSTGTIVHPPENPPSPSPVSRVPSPDTVVINQPTVPSSESVPALIATEPVRSLNGKVLKILLAEDSKTLVDLFKRFWQIKGHEVLVASNGQEAIEIFKSKTISIIFLDIEMPLKDGLTVAKEIRAFEAERHVTRTPIIGVSGYALKSYKEKAIESGMDDFVSKGSGYPFREIYQIVLKYCGE